MLLTTVGVQTGYEDTTAAAGVTYWYQVAAVNEIGSGPRSNELSARLVEPASAPTLLGAPADGAVALSWTVPSDDGGGAISAYNVYRAVGSGSEAFLASTTGSETFYVDFAVTNGTEYTYRVAAVNAAGEGALSNAVSVTPAPADQITAPSPPQSLAVVKGKGSNSTAIGLTWQAPVSDGGSPIASYFVYRRGPGETSFTLIGLTSASTTTYTDATVAKCTTYTYYVTAFNTYFESPPSNELTVKSK